MYIETSSYPVFHFRKAARLAGLVLKPSKCVFGVSIFELSHELVATIKAWLGDHIPEWRELEIVSAARYYLKRVEELAEAGAPALPTILGYNECVAIVFSYALQFVPLPDPSSIASLEERGIHKSFGLSPNAMSREPSHSFDHFCAKVLTDIVAMVRASGRSVSLLKNFTRSLCLFSGMRCLSEILRPKLCP